MQLQKRDPASLGFKTLSEREVQQKERFTAFVVGILALSLAFVVLVLDIAGLGHTCARSSISHYFFDPRAGVFFVMALTFVAAFMIRYKGDGVHDGWVASVGGLGALLLAFFPTFGPRCVAEGTVDYRPALVVQEVAPSSDGNFLLTLSQPRDGEGAALSNAAAASQDPAEPVKVTAVFSNPTYQFFHFLGALVVLVSLLYFTGFAFRRTNDPKDEDDDGNWTPAKRARNLIYTACAAAMVVGGALILSAMVLSEETLAAWGDVVWVFRRPVYWGEAAFLVAFGVAWMVKSRFWLTQLDDIKAAIKPTF